MKLETLIDIGRAAGREIMAVYADKSFSSIDKTDGSPVTEADHRAEAVILRGLRSEFATIPIVAEEEAAAGRVPHTAGCFFLVDPLDGTREFIARNDEFTVNIAFIENGVPVVGMIFAPALGSMFVGSAAGAFHALVGSREMSRLEPIRTRAAPAKLAAIASRSNGAERSRDWLQRFEVGAYTSAGSSLKFCRVATGDADIYPRFGRTMEWDTAAGDAILRAAGGVVTALDGETLAYGKRGRAGEADFANPSFIAYGDPSLVVVGTPN